MIIGDHILNHFSSVIGLWEGEEMNLLKYYFESLENEIVPSILSLPGHGVR